MLENLRLLQGSSALRKLAHYLSESPQTSQSRNPKLPENLAGTSVAAFISAMTRMLNESETWEVLQRGNVGHLGCMDQDEPYVVPINYLVEGCVYSHSLPCRKVSALRVHPRVCLQVSQIYDDFHWRSAIAFGSFEETTGEAERDLILRKLLEHFPKLTPVESQWLCADAFQSSPRSGGLNLARSFKAGTSPSHQTPSRQRRLKHYSIVADAT